MATLKALQQCSKIRKYAVFGFIREESAQLSLPQIPTIIEYLCLSYYSPDTDFFNEFDKDRIKLSMTQMKATVIKGTFNKSIYVYGYQWINSLSKNKHEWKFKIDSNMVIQPGIMEFGLTANKSYERNAFLKCNEGEKNYNYSIKDDGSRFFLQINDGLKTRKDLKGSETYVPFPKHITIKLEDGRLSFLANGEMSTKKGNWWINTYWEDTSIKFRTGKDIKYRIAVSMRSYKASCILQEYTNSACSEQ